MVASQPVVHHASRITSGCQGEVYRVLKAERNVVLPVTSAVRSRAQVLPSLSQMGGGEGGMRWDAMGWDGTMGAKNPSHRQRSPINCFL